MPAAESEMLKAAEQVAQESAWKLGHAPPLVLAVTVLTSLDAAALSQIGLDPNVSRQVRRLANMANQAGLRGLVCSPREVAELRQMLPASTQLVIPGIRPQSAPADDQKRTLTPREALALGANWLVIGRPICAAEDPARRRGEDSQRDCRIGRDPLASAVRSALSVKAPYPGRAASPRRPGFMTLCSVTDSTTRHYAIRRS